MAQEVYQFSLKAIEKMKKEYLNVQTPPPPGAIFRAKTNYAVITAYKSGKVMFQGNSPQKEASQWLTQTDSVNKPYPQKRAVAVNEPASDIYTSSHIGSDESGTGDYFGPITTAAVYLTDEQIPLLKSWGIQDSKKITDEQVKILAKRIAESSIPYSLLVLHNKKYNSLQHSGWSQGKMKAMMHHHAIQNLLKKIPCLPYSAIVIDQFCKPEIYKKYLASENKQVLPKTFYKTKAESFSTAVAAASVIARASFLKEMDKLSENLGYSLLKGASNKVDQLAANIMKTKGETVLESCAKIHFANTNKAKKLIRMS
ncbi:ribonuclease HIII [Virgibacillus sp. W0181]|uniref:ribonuclease HIII n=1 Tax=Virgibacillus sp. W0181 TaxID=3391581 RepID=UPI003F450750